MAVGRSAGKLGRLDFTASDLRGRAEGGLLGGGLDSLGSLDGFLASVLSRRRAAVVYWWRVLRAAGRSVASLVILVVVLGSLGPSRADVVDVLGVRHVGGLDHGREYARGTGFRIGGHESVWQEANRLGVVWRDWGWGLGAERRRIGVDITGGSVHGRTVRIASVGRVRLRLSPVRSCGQHVLFPVDWCLLGVLEGGRRSRVAQGSVDGEGSGDPGRANVGAVLYKRIDRRGDLRGRGWRRRDTGHGGGVR